MATTQYNRVIRKIVVGFGDLFNNITLVRYKNDGTETERFIIPIAYDSKERYVMRLQDDPDLDKKVQVTLPRMSFEMTGLSYDSSRKQNTNVKNIAGGGLGAITQYNPVPYNFDFSLYLYVRNIEDATQVIEHILPYFTPDYTIKVNMIPEMGIIKEVPVILNSTDHEIIYEGDREQSTRMVIWTLKFTVKGFIFGKTSTTGLIQNSITNIYNKITAQDVITFNMDLESGAGNYQIGENVYQGYSINSATATAKVVSWNENMGLLLLTNISGNFVSDKPIYGTKTYADYLFSSYDSKGFRYVQINAYDIVDADSTYATADGTLTVDNTEKISLTINETPNG
jgi:hypothetical protein